MAGRFAAKLSGPSSWEVSPAENLSWGGKLRGAPCSPKTDKQKQAKNEPRDGCGSEVVINPLRDPNRRQNITEGMQVMPTSQGYRVAECRAGFSLGLSQNQGGSELGYCLVARGVVGEPSSL